MGAACYTASGWHGNVGIVTSEYVTALGRPHSSRRIC